MISLIIAALVSSAHAAEPAKQQFSTQGPSLTKLQAVKLKLDKPAVKVYRCTEVELNDKLSLVNVKTKK
jgi:hypothetical protein